MSEQPGSRTVCLTLKGEPEPMGWKAQILDGNEKGFPEISHK